tara:strand:- start:11 stop:439 length:429 start_codon:yes stop_codon:yes gene_type:complete
MYMRALNDPFLERFFARIPRELVTSFSDDQLLAIKQAFAEDMTRTHSLDFRISVPLLLGRFYFVAVAGPERRTKARRRRERTRRPPRRLFNTLFSLSLLAITLLALLGAAYTLKSAFGINLLPDTSLGLWTEIKTQFRLMFH